MEKGLFLKWLGKNMNNIDGYVGDEPVLSVVIPVYNTEKYLRECLDSVVSQSYRNLQILIVDDGSTDNSRAICDEYMAKDGRITVIRQDNYIIGHARNVGLKWAKGKYIIFLDSDDYWIEDTAKELIAEAEKNDLQVLVFSALPFDDGVEAVRKKTYTHKCQNNIVKTGVDSLICAKEHGEYYSQPCLRLYRLDYLREQGFLFDEGIIHEDESFSFLAYINALRVECLGKRYYMRRYRKGSVTTSSSPAFSGRGYKKAAESLLGYAEKKELSEKEKRLYIGQARSFMRMLFLYYHQLKRDKKTGAADKSDIKEISASAHELVRRIRSADIAPWHIRLLYSNFHMTYFCWLILKKTGKL